MTMQHPRGVTVILGIGIALGVFVVLIVAAMFYGSRTQTPSTNSSNQNTSITDVVRLACTQTSDCAAYCGLESTYTPYCDSTKHCTCSYSGEPVPSGNANISVTDFASCAASGNPVQESYPRKCSVGGVTFTEVLTNSNVNAAKNTNQSTNANVSTAGWKTYTNNVEGYTIKYPANWYVASSSPETVNVVPPDADKKTSMELGPYLNITSVNKISDVAPVNATSKVIAENDCNQNRRTLLVNGISSTQQDESCFATIVTSYIPKGVKYIQVRWAEVFENDYPQYSTILSSLTFTK